MVADVMFGVVWFGLLRTRREVYYIFLCLNEDGERNEDELKMIRKGKKGLTTTSSYKLDGICMSCLVPYCGFG